MVYGHWCGCGGVAAGEVRGGAAAPGRAVCAVGAGRGGQIAGARRDRGGGPCFGGVQVAGAAGGDRAGVRRGPVGSGAPGRWRTQAGRRGRPGPGAGAAGAGGAGGAHPPGGSDVGAELDDAFGASPGRRADCLRASGQPGDSRQAAARRRVQPAGQRQDRGGWAAPRPRWAVLLPQRPGQRSPEQRGSSDQRGHEEEGTRRGLQKQRGRVAPSGDA